MTALSTLAANNAGFGNILKTIQSGGAYIDPRGRVLSKTALKPITGYSNTLDIRGVAHAYDENGSLIEIPREPLQLYKFDVAGDGKFTIPKLRNEKDGGYYADITLNATKDGGNFTLEDKDTTAAGKYFKATKGTDYSNQQWSGMSRGLANISNAVQTGEATVDAKKSVERWDDGQGNEGSKEYYALRDGNGTEVGALYDVPGRPDLKYAKNVGNETAGGSHNVYLQVDPKSGAVAPIQDWSKQVTYNESQGKTFWQQQKEAAVAFAPLAAMIFAPVAGEAIGAALMEGGILTSASAAAASATTAAQAAAASAAATATATAVGTGIANATLGIVQGKPVDQAIGDAAISTAIQIGTPAAVGDIRNQIAQVTSNPAVINILTSSTVSAGTALLKGKNALDAFEKGGTNALVNQIGIDIPGFADMNATAKKVISDAVSSKLLGNDLKLTPEYMLNTVIATANQNKAALDSGYDNADQKLAAEEGGFTDAKTFKTADKAGFTNIGEYQDAKDKGYDNANDFRIAKASGYLDAIEYKEGKAGSFTSADSLREAKLLGIDDQTQLNKYKSGEFTDKEEYADAIKKGYDNKAEYDDAMETGWKNKKEQIAAGEINITDPTEYRQVLTNAANEFSAKVEGYDSAAQQQASQEGGFPNAATFKVADKAGFTNNAEFEAASNARFNNASDYRGALAAGVETPEEFKQYKESNYSDVLDYRNAAAKGFYTKAEFEDATVKGYSDKETYDKAEGLGFRNASDYTVATANNIDAKTWNENNHLAVDDGWENYAEQLNAEKLGFDDPEIWRYASAVDLENEGQDITENYLASQMVEIGNDWFAMPNMDVIFNVKTGEVQDESGNKVDDGSANLSGLKVPLDFFRGIMTNTFVNRQPPTSTTPPDPATDPKSQVGQVIPDFQDPSQIAKRKERGTPYSYNPEYSILNPQAPLTQQTQPQQKTQPLAPNTSDVVQSGLFSGILSPYNPQNTQGGPYG